MVLTEADKSYLENLVKSLVTAEEFRAFTENIIAKLKDQEKIIADHDKRLQMQDERIEKLESLIELKQNAIDKLKIHADNNEQYSRRSSIRIHGFETKQGETQDDVMEIVRSCANEINVDFNEADIFRAHRVGRSTKNEKTGKFTRSIIVKYKSWDARTQMYKSRPKYVAKEPGSDAKQQNRRFTISLDLTKRNQDLLDQARLRVVNHPKVDYAFCDINCALGIRLKDGKLIFFNDQNRLDDIIEKLVSDEDY